MKAETARPRPFSVTRSMSLYSRTMIGSVPAGRCARTASPPTSRTGTSASPAAPSRRSASSTMSADRVHSRPMRMQAAVLEEFGAPLVVQEVDLADPGPGEVLVRLEACGVCHTDMYTASGVDPSGYAPTVLGHEGAGVVERVGEGVSLVGKGDHVVTLFSPQCGDCVHCRSPLTNLCLALREQQNLGYLPDGTTRLARGDEPLRHFMGTSTFAECTVMPEIALARIDHEAPL